MRARVLVAAALLTAGLSFSSGAQEPRATRDNADWPMYRRNPAGTGYSPLSQIDLANVAQLAPAWTFRINAAGGANVNSQATPIVIDGVMYFPGRDRIEALEADTGR
jgi:glucose dehydrogenase